MRLHWAEQAEIVFLRLYGWTYEAIAIQVGRDVSTVKRCMKRLTATARKNTPEIRTGRRADRVRRKRPARPE